MALTTCESIMLTFAIIGSAHLIVTLLSKLEDEDVDCRPYMQRLAKHRFLNENNIVIKEGTSQLFYH
ncbi:unnamed protein product [Ceutorhynchus assimilis]|uniref:Uncharacterized protein n=1 Tax=Ceutorhynchus assimilis TaxID=467358 RepID=A0A9N9MRG6_9CUCU|nr:unnamed protein product [Ceutorhynchus assimilis]